VTRRRVRAAAFAVALLLGCGEDRAAAPAPAPQARPAQRRSEPAGVRIRRQPDGRLRVRANRAPSAQVLEELARVEGFTVAQASRVAASRSPDLDLTNASAEDVLASVLREVPYHVEYGPAHGAGDAEIVRLTVGRARARRPAENLRAEEPAPAARAEPERGKQRVERARAPEGERLEGEPGELTAALTGAPDPATRAAAARALGDIEGGEDAFRAARSLVGALSDHDPEVVAAAVDALESLHDLIPDPAHLVAVRKLRDHSDPRVRSAAEAFLEWNEDGR
jgi:hypothetical protein